MTVKALALPPADFEKIKLNVVRRDPGKLLRVSSYRAGNRTLEELALIDSTHQAFLLSLAPAFTVTK